MKIGEFFSKTMIGTSVLAMVITPAASPVMAQKISKADSTDDSLVNCNIFNHRPTSDNPTSNNVVWPAPSPPPALPPPSISSPNSAAISKPVIVTGQKIQTGHGISADVASSSSAPGKISTLPFPGLRYPRPIPIKQDNEKYEGEEVASIKRVIDDPVSTFSVDVDTGSYSNVRRFLNQGKLPPKAAVRSEEMINYFRYDYPLPTNRNTPFSVTTDMAQTPWNEDTKLLRIGLRGYDIDRSKRPSANLVFLIDVSGSMYRQDKLPLVKQTLLTLSQQLRHDDKVSIVVYSGRVGTLLQPTSNKNHIIQALSCMEAGGSTAGGDALKIAYQVARNNYDDDGINRIIMTTDGDFNVGTTGTDQLKEIVAKERESGVTLTMLGYGQGNYREEVMEGIANVGNGNYAYIDSALEAQKVMKEELSSTLFTIAKDVKLQLEFNPTYVSQYRLIGYENRLLAEEDFNNDKIDAGDIGASHQVTALYEIVPTGSKGWFPKRRYEVNEKQIQSEKNNEMGFLKLRYKLPNSDNSSLIEYPLSVDKMKSDKMPSDDMAFAIAVGAFGQKLRGDKYLNDYSFEQITTLAGDQDIFWRKEFVKLINIASVSGDYQP